MKKALSTLLSFLLLVSSSGIAYAQHYCGEHRILSEITLGEKDLSCGMAADMPVCEEEQEDHGCCDNEYTKVETDDTFEKSSFEIEFSPVFLQTFTAVFMRDGEETHSDHDFDFKDPAQLPVKNDLQLLYETFLI